MNDYSKKTIIEEKRTHRAWTTIEIARGMYQTHAYKRSSDFTVIMLQLMLDSHAMRAFRGGQNLRNRARSGVNRANPRTEQSDEPFCRM